MDCTGFNASVHTMQLQQQHQPLFILLEAKTSRSRKSQVVNGPLECNNKALMLVPKYTKSKTEDLISNERQKLPNPNSYF